MALENRWVKALKIDPQALQLWQVECPPDMPLIVWCLNAGHVSPGAYLTWAKEAYGLPSLQADFFEKAFRVGEVQDLWTTGSWQPWAYPVAHWEDVTIVACTEPPENPEPGSTYVLADPTLLKAIWQKHSVRHDSSHTQPIDGPTGVHLNETKLFRLELEGLMETSASEAPAVEAPVEQTNTRTKVHIPTETQAVAKMEEPVAETPAVEIQPTAVSMPSYSASSLSDISSASENTSISVRGEHENGEILSVLEKLKTHYTAALILRLEDTIVVPYRWGVDLKLDRERAQVNLGYPSLFRIVAKTLQPYHGYIVDSPVHREFFMNLGQNELPKSVTCVPIIIDTRLWGMTLAFGGASAQKGECLNAIERVTAKLIEKLGQVWLKSA